MRDDDSWRESRRFFSGPSCVCTLNYLDKNQLAELTSSSTAVLVRGGVLKFTQVVDNDTTVHDVHTYTGAFLFTDDLTSTTFR